MVEGNSIITKKGSHSRDAWMDVLKENKSLVWLSIDVFPSDKSMNYVTSESLVLANIEKLFSAYVD